jgi:hypothetical protein
MLLFSLIKNKKKKACDYFLLAGGFISKLQRIYEFETKLTKLSYVYLYEIKTENK